MSLSRTSLIWSGSSTFMDSTCLHERSANLNLEGWWKQPFRRARRELTTRTGHPINGLRAQARPVRVVSHRRKASPGICLPQFSSIISCFLVRLSIEISVLLLEVASLVTSAASIPNRIIILAFTATKVVLRVVIIRISFVRLFELRVHGLFVVVFIIITAIV